MKFFLPGVFFGDLDGVESLACVGPALSRTSCGMFSFNASSSAVLFLLGFENRLTGVEWRKQKNLLAKMERNSCDSDNRKYGFVYPYLAISMSKVILSALLVNVQVNQLRQIYGTRSTRSMFGTIGEFTPFMVRF